MDRYSRHWIPSATLLRVEYNDAARAGWRTRETLEEIEMSIPLADTSSSDIEVARFFFSQGFWRVVTQLSSQGSK